MELLDSQGHSGGNYPPVRLIEFELIELGGVKEVVAVLNTIQTSFLTQICANSGIVIDFPLFLFCYCLGLLILIIFSS